MSTAELADRVAKDSVFRRWHWLGSPSCMAALLFAAALWLYTRDHGFSPRYHPDEPSKVAQVLTGERNLRHPLLLLRGTEAALWLTGAPCTEQSVVVAGRTVSALFAAGTVVGMALAVSLIAGRGVGWLAGLFVLGGHQLFEVAHFMKEDPALGFGWAGLWLALAGFGKGGGRRWILAAGCAAGVAASGKYLGLLAVPFGAVAVLILGAGGGRGTPARTEPRLPRRGWSRDWRARLRPRRDVAEPGESAVAGRTTARELALFLTAFAAVFIAINFPLLHDLPQLDRSLRFEMRHVTQGESGITQRVPHAWYLERVASDVAPAILGGAALFLAAGFLETGRRRRFGGLLVAFVLGYLAILSCSPKVSGRYLLPVTIALHGLAALGVVAAAERVRDWLPERRRSWVVPVVVAALAIGIGFSETMALRKRMLAFRKDSRAELVAWLAAHTPPGAAIVYETKVGLEWLPATASALAPFRLLKKDIAADFGTLAELKARGVAFVITHGTAEYFYTAERFTPQPAIRAQYEQRRAFYQELRATAPIAWKRKLGPVQELMTRLTVYRVE